MAAEAFLVTQRGHAHHHRIAVLVVGEELQRCRFAANLIAGVVEIRQVLDLRQRQHAHVGVALGEAEDHRFVEQRVEHAAALERLVQALGDGIHAALLRHVLAEQQRLGYFASRSCSA
jgi:hypothetical protein